MLSQLLLIIFMDKCVRDAMFGLYGEGTLTFADDVTVITESVNDLQEASYRWYQVLSNAK